MTVLWRTRADHNRFLSYQPLVSGMTVGTI
jgi:hypothetical protein